jgi:hypothetical protein
MKEAASYAMSRYENAKATSNREKEELEEKQKTADIEEGLAYYIDNELYGSPEELRARIDSVKEQISPSLLRKAEDIYAAYAREYAADEKSRQENEQKTSAAEKTANADKTVSAILSDAIDGNYVGTPEQLRQEIEAYLGDASESIRAMAQYYLAQYDTRYQANANEMAAAADEIAKYESEANVLAGRDVLSRNGADYRIVGEALEPDAAHDDNFMAALQDIGMKGPYDQRLQNGMTVTIKRKQYVFFNGDWYPAQKIG